MCVWGGGGRGGEWGGVGAIKFIQKSCELG